MTITQYSASQIAAAALATLAFAPAMADQPQWVQQSNTNGQVYYVDSDNVQLAGGAVKVWIMENTEKTIRASNQL